MELMDAIRNRRAVREYTKDAIGRPTIESLIAAATLAPSAMNLQPWAFAALLDSGRIDQYAVRAKAWLLDNLSLFPLEPSARRLLDDPQFDIFYHAPALVIVLAKSANSQAIEDCCLAAQNLLLAARDTNLGTCWIGFARPWLNLPETKRELGLPESYQVVAPIILGHPKAWPESHGRQPAEIHWLG